jgi:hypothetical protein
MGPTHVGDFFLAITLDERQGALGGINARRFA